MQLVLLGCPGAGKGTQARFICEKYNIALISTGDMLRAAMVAGTKLGKQVAQIVDRGQLVPDEVMIALVKERLQAPDCEKGCLLDGFPRTIPQAESLSRIPLDLDAVIEIRVPDETLVKRLSGRRVHPASGRVYHVDYQPPRVAGCDDETGEPLIQRADDEEATVRKRLALYHQQTEPLANYYASRGLLKVVDGTQSVSEVSASIFKALSAVHKQGEKYAGS